MLYPKAVIQLFLFFLFKLAQCDILVYKMDSDIIELEFKYVSSKFGGPIPPEGIMGLVVYSNPANACTTIDSPPLYHNYTGKWIVLIKRYECNFEQKVRNAQKAGFDAAIVHNVDSSVLKPMAADNPQGIYIPSVFIGSESGMLLKDNYLYDQGYFILINDYIPSNIPTQIFLIFSGFIGFFFVVMVLFVIVKYFKDRLRRRVLCLPNSCLKKLSIHKVKQGDHYDMCSICLEDYVENDKLRILPCSHAYHSKCIDPWLTKSRRVCPICKRKVFPSGEAESDEESDTENLTAPLVGSSRTATNGGTFSALSIPFLGQFRQDSPSSASYETVSSMESHHSRSSGDPEIAIPQEYSINFGGPGGTTSNMGTDNRRRAGNSDCAERYSI